MDSFNTIIDTIIGKLNDGIELTKEENECYLKCKVVSTLHAKHDNHNKHDKNNKNNKQPKLKKCYICKRYNENNKKSVFCKTCHNFNTSKRNYMPDLSGKIAIVTGGRIKIGFETAIWLLQCNCTVIITTRFAGDAEYRYKHHENYNEWKNRLYIYQVNFLYFKHVELFVNKIKESFTHVDYLINNAAQTIARPNEFYIHHLEHKPQQSMIISDHRLLLEDKMDNMSNSNCEQISKHISEQRDEFDQALDIRNINSWVLDLEDVPITELTSVYLINTIIPFYLNQQLVGLMTKRKNLENQETKNDVSYIINVSSMEGKFNRAKVSKHPHTNMAKASLNMMTRTCGKDYYKKYNIVMVSVDTGWNTIEEPNSYHKVAPLDCKDGAARILDPIFTNKIQSGIFYKDFIQTDW